MNKLITTKQAQELKALGLCNNDVYICFCKTKEGYVKTTLVDEVIDWLRRRYDVHIYTSIPPFVDPTDNKHPILYRYAVKYCNKRDGWNGRVHIGETNLSKNVYSLKRQAIWLAIRWIKANKKPKVSLGKVRRN
jgi:hypothetical protein